MLPLLLKKRYNTLFQKYAVVSAGRKQQVQAATGKADLYKDKWIKLIGSLAASHYIEILGREESWFDLLLHQFYYVDLISGFCIAFIVWEAIARITIYLDANYDWLEHTMARSFLQIGLGILTPTVVVHLLTYIQFRYLLHQNMADTSWFIYELPVCIMIIALINTYYLAYYFYAKYKLVNLALQQKEQLQQSLPEAVTLSDALPVKKKRQVFIINKGNRNIPIPVAQIACFYKKDAYNYLCTFHKETYLVDESLDEIYESLDECLFFRANRQTIINFHACNYYSALEHGKIEVHLLQSTEEPIVVSQKRAANFKEWISK